MSDREKKLIILFGGAVVLMALLWGYKWFNQQKIIAENEHRSAEQMLRDAELFKQSREQVADEIEWLQQHEPQPEAAEQVPARLQGLCASEAANAGMQIKQQKILANTLDNDAGAPPSHYQRAKVEFTVTGREESLYQWFDRLHQPDSFRAITALRLTPNREDDTTIDCTVTIEQWYVPLAADQTPETTETP